MIGAFFVDILVLPFCGSLDQEEIFCGWTTNIDLLWDRVSFFARLWTHDLGAFRGISLSYLNRDWWVVLY